MFGLRRALLISALVATTACRSKGATNPEDLVVRTVTLDAAAMCPATPAECWGWFTQDIHLWWDHTFSESPHALVLDARVGGSFYESFDGKGNGAEHARVIYAQAPEMLRLDGPLGLSGLSVHLVHELRFEAVAGGGTRVQVRTQMTGAVDDEVVGAVRGVWQHFLVERFAPYAEAQAAGEPP